MLAWMGGSCRKLKGKRSAQNRHRNNLPGTGPCFAAPHSIPGSRAGSSNIRVWHAGVQDTYDKLSRAAARETATQKKHTPDARETVTQKHTPDCSLPAEQKQCVEPAHEEEASQEAREPAVMKNCGETSPAQDCSPSPAGSPGGTSPRQDHAEMLLCDDQALDKWQAYKAPTGVRSLDLDMLRMPAAHKSQEAGMRKTPRPGEDCLFAGQH